MLGRIVSAGAGAAFAAIVWTQPAAAFPDKNITFIIPYSPGGGFDAYVRLISPYVEKYLPKKVKVIPKNMPGAGGRKGLTAGYRAKPDGYTMVLANMPGNAIAPITGKKVSYDLDKITWLAQLSTDYYLMGVSSKSPIKTLDELVKKGSGGVIKMTATGPGSTAYAVSKVMQGVIGFKGDMISGYKGTKEMTIGIIRGDADAASLPNTSTRKYIQAGDIRALFTTAPKSPWKGVPTAGQLNLGELDGLGIARMVAAPPGLPDKIKGILESALLKAMADPGLQAAAKKAKRPFAPLGSAKAREVVQRNIKVYLKFKTALMAK